MANRNNPDFLSASTIKGDKVVNGAGEDIGKIEELMIDLTDGRVGYAVLSFGGFLGMGDKLFAIPWKAFQPRVHEHAFLLDVPKETLENAKGFDKDNWPLTTHEDLSKTYTYYGYKPYWQAEVTEQTREMPEEVGPEKTTRTEKTSRREVPDFLSASTIKKDKVVNRAGNDVGKIDELMIDLQDGRVAYVVVSRSGLLGMGSKLIAVPWQAFQIKTHEHKFLLDVPKNILDKEKGFDKGRWPLNREDLSGTYANYGYRPYWEAAATAAAVQSAFSKGKTEQPEVSAEVIRDTETIEMETRKTETRGAETTETETKEVVQMDTGRTEVEETDEEMKARQERERLEGLRGTQEEKLSQLEKQRAEKETEAQKERERLAQLEKERIEAERQAEAERKRLTELEKELQEARKQEETEKVARLEMELKEVQTQEETRRDRLAQLEKECAEARKQAEAEKERLAELEKEKTEVEKQAGAERAILAQMEKERMEAETRMEETRLEMPDILSASTIKSDRVVNTAGEDIGRIEELMIDLNSGRVAYAVLSFGGYMGMSDKMFAIPWDSLKCNVHEHAFILDTPKDVLQNAEGFDKEHWPITREKLSSTYTYYGYQPYWQREAAEQAAVTPGQRERYEQLTAEEKMAQQDKERFERMEEKETDKEERERLERERIIAERREKKYH
jgi:sporulation protein YlmC with PRC-barrel domain